MQITSMTALELAHRLLFRALIEMRAEGHEHKNKVVFHLADLFHNAVLEMENAAEGKTSYESVLNMLEQRAKEKGCEKWLCSTLRELESAQPPTGLKPSGVSMS